MTKGKTIFLADDDIDDCVLFEDALKEICNETQLVVAKDGEHLMKNLHANVPNHKGIIFLDLNMPCKNGFECLEEIRQHETLKTMPVIIFSTTAQEQSVQKAYRDGANYYIKKPVTFSGLKNVIQKVLAINWEADPVKPSLQNFVVHSDT